MTSHNYIFLTTTADFQNISRQVRSKYEKEFLKELTSNKNVHVTAFATLGLKVNTKILLWFQANTAESIQSHLNKLLHTHLGRYLQITYTLFGMIRPTQYSSSPESLDTSWKGGKYLIIYPFTKTKEWHVLDIKTRKELMEGHIAIGKKFRPITQLLLYAYGVDDSEFIVSYETDDLSMFQSLVMALRVDKVRAYTLKDTPIFTCIYKTNKEVVGFL